MRTVISRWGESGPRPEPLADNNALFESFEVADSIEVACSPEDAWRLVTDIPRIGEFSPECIEARWIEGHGPELGARFEGTNRIIDEKTDTALVWIRPCTVTASDCPTRFSYSVGDRYDGTPASIWTFEIEEAPGGCRIRQQFRHLPDGLSGIRVQADGAPGQAEAIVQERIGGLRSGIRETLSAMKRSLENAETSR